MEIMDTSKETENNTSRNLTKGEATRRRILDAARTVFSQHPYHAASVRMVGKTGGFDHPIIHYYFPKKSGLFECVMDEHVCAFRLFIEHWFDDLGAYTTDKALLLFIERIIAFHLSNKDIFRTLMQNTAHVESVDSFSVSVQYEVFHDSFLKKFRQKIDPNASDKEVSQFVSSFIVLAANYLGASSTYALFLGMKGECDAYWQWVKETIHYIFLPRMERIIFDSRPK